MYRTYNWFGHFHIALARATAQLLAYIATQYYDYNALRKAAMTESTPPSSRAKAIVVTERE